MDKILVMFGTRPEALKLIPIIRELQRQKVGYETLHTGQHAEMLMPFLQSECIRPDHTLPPLDGGDMAQCKASMLWQICRSIGNKHYAAILVQGDTLSTATGAEYGFLRAIPVAHMEAGMRTYERKDPYPEEVFRRTVSLMADLHFCPSEKERSHLIAEGVKEECVHVVGNSFVDYHMKSPIEAPPLKKQILVTLHRRENIPHLHDLLAKIAALAQKTSAYHWLFPVHPSPNILPLVQEHLSGLPNLTCCPPLPPDAFYRELLCSAMVISDSGGVQEECILNGKKMLVLRCVSERRTDLACIRLVPPDTDLEKPFYTLLQSDPPKSGSHCYGQGHAAEKIVQILKHDLA